MPATEAAHYLSSRSLKKSVRSFGVHGYFGIDAKRPDRPDVGTRAPAPYPYCCCHR